MKFFSGTRTNSGKPGRQTPAQMMKDKMQGKAPREKTPSEKYKEMMDAKIQKLTEDAMMGIKKGGFKMPGTKEGPPKEMSKNAKMMMKLLAMQKLQKEHKAEKKRLKEEMWKLGAEKRAKALQKAEAESAEYYRKQEEEAAATAAANSNSSSSSWWGVGSSSDDNKGGWW